MLNEKKIIIRAAEGLGNQLFMYANGLSLAKKNNASLYIDNESGFFKKKNKLRSRKYNLDIFSTNINICRSTEKFNTYPRDLLRKFLKKIDIFKQNKLFLIDKYKNNKTSFKELKPSFADTLYVEGHFESENYFSSLKSILQNSLTVNSNLIDKDNTFINMIKSSNAVSIHIRKHRFSEENNKDIEKSEKFTQRTIEYIYSSIEFFKKNIEKPKFFIWSNDFSNLDNYFDTKDFIFIKNNNLATDFYLFSLCKHFIVGPSTFHWWGAWLNNHSKKICVRPKELFLNPSDNKDFWPSAWRTF